MIILAIVAIYSVGAHTRGRSAIAGALLVAALSLTGTIADVRRRHSR